MIGIVAVTIGTALVPIIRHIALRVGFVDRPDNHHKRHAQPVPLGGGYVVFVGAILALLLLSYLSPVVEILLNREASLLRGFLLAALILLVVGTIDDLRGMRGRHKLLGQILAALVMTGHGLEVKTLEVSGWTIELGIMSVPFTVLWLLASINAINLLDGLDGLAATICLVTLIAISWIAIVTGQAVVTVLGIAAAGGCAAFLHANFPPATMFLGDAGSMLLGAALGGLTLLGCSNGPGMLSLAPAVALLTLPFMDSAFALLRRYLTGRSIYAMDRGHLHHSLMNALSSHHLLLLVVALSAAASGLSAILSVQLQNDAIAIISIGFIGLLFVAFRLFGHVEARLLRSKLAAPVRRLRRKASQRNRAHEVAVRLQGEREWELLWESVTEWAEKLELLRVALDINLPAMREGFHANWYQPCSRERHECWEINLPLFADGIAVGRLTVLGQKRNKNEAISTCLEQLSHLLDPFEEGFSELAAAPGTLVRRMAARSVPVEAELVPQHAVASGNLDLNVPQTALEV